MKQAFPTFKKTTRRSFCSAQDRTDKYAGTLYALELLFAAALAGVSFYLVAVTITIHVM